MTRLIAVMIVLTCLAACKKDSSPNPSLVGKWLQIEHYDQRPTVGCNCWVPVSATAGNKIEFKRDGSYQQTPPMYSSVWYCPGTYRVINDTTLGLTSNCSGTPTEDVHQFSKDGDILIIEYLNPNPDFNFKMKLKRVRAF